MEFYRAADVQRRLKKILSRIDLPHIRPSQVVCVRSIGSRSRARARIWSFPRVWQVALRFEPHYIIEVLSEKFDKLSRGQQDKILIHELLHIPKTFSGALRPHRMRRFNLGRELTKYYKQYQKRREKEAIS